VLVPSLAVVFLLAGASMARLALSHGRRRKAFLAGSTRATGTVVGARERPDPDSILGRTCFPTIRFRTSDGREVEFESTVGSDAHVRPVGEEVAVRYRWDAPHSAEIDSFLALWGPTLLFALLGSVFLGLGLGLLTGIVPV
jgi:hypothetical protein